MSAHRVFQSTPPRGKRLDLRQVAIVDDQFQSTPPRGKRRVRPPRCSVHGTVSIHAPAREATRQAGSHLWSMLFQSTPPRGKRPFRHDRLSGLWSFQSTPPRGKRLDRTAAALGISVFQSTPPRGKRRSLSGVASLESLFQSTPPRGKRLPRGCCHSRPSGAFQSTPPRGKRRWIGSGVGTRAMCFNPRPRAGSDAACGGVQQGGAVSIHAPAREATWWTAAICGRNGFNPRPRAGSDVGSETQPGVPVGVSIHAPAREATRSSSSEVTSQDCVSIHAPAREATVGAVESRSK